MDLPVSASSEAAQQRGMRAGQTESLQDPPRKTQTNKQTKRLNGRSVKKRRYYFSFTSACVFFIPFLLPIHVQHDEQSLLELNEPNETSA